MGHLARAGGTSVLCIQVSTTKASAMLSSSEPATLCELGLEDGGKCFVEVQSVREEGQVKSLDLRVIEGVSVWSGAAHERLGWRRDTGTTTRINQFVIGK